MSERPRRGLVWRLYAIGVVQVLLLALAAIGIAFFLSVPERPDPQHLALELQQLLANHAPLQPLLERCQRRRILISMYDPAGALLGTNVEPALPLPDWAAHASQPASRESHARLPSRDYDWFGTPPFPNAPSGDIGRSEMQLNAYVALGRAQQQGMLVMRLPRPRFNALPAVLTLIVGLIIIAVGAALNARWLTLPLERLSQATRSLGQGDFAARARADRNDELGEVARVFNEMAERVQQLLLAEKELLANVAHELLTPLARIRVALEIASESDAEQVRSSLAEIAVDLGELESLIDDVLTATRLDLGTGAVQPAMFALHIEEISARVIAERAAERFRARHPERPFSFECECSEPMPLIEADPVLFRRVLDNVLENADKYSRDSQQLIRLRVFLEQQAVVFNAIDHGLGIPSADLPKIFAPFFRGERSRSRETGGVGLGLTLAKRIVEAHGGSIELASEPGAGTNVRVRLPARLSSAAV